MCDKNMRNIIKFYFEQMVTKLRAKYKSMKNSRLNIINIISILHEFTD